MPSSTPTRARTVPPPSDGCPSALPTGRPGGSTPSPTSTTTRRAMPSRTPSGCAADWLTPAPWPPCPARLAGCAQMIGRPGGERHDGQRRVGAALSRAHAAIHDVEVRYGVAPEVGVDDAVRR